MASVQKGFVQQVRCTQADLDYAHFRDEVLPWTKLDSAPPIAGASVPKFAISLVNFDYGLQFVQSRADKKGNCSVRYSVVCTFYLKFVLSYKMVSVHKGLARELKSFGTRVLTLMCFLGRLWNLRFLEEG